MDDQKAILTQSQTKYQLAKNAYRLGLSTQKEKTQAKKVIAFDAWKQLIAIDIDPLKAVTLVQQAFKKKAYYE